MNDAISVRFVERERSLPQELNDLLRTERTFALQARREVLAS